ncbi:MULTISPECIES: hypothetical protein [unclassified Variovorax]|uniref:hypothetical protein n=1 Tax=unclassified Variovorax TaxID=663243 RepID=UPI001BD25888|nr:MULTISPECIES: hypothetical protein [unclassified Variovorax]
MSEISELPDETLLAQAQEWRRRALHGDKRARGFAHALEAEIRRRFGTPTSSMMALDTRPLDARSRPWWRLW